MKLLQITVLLAASFSLFSCGGSDRENRFEKLEEILNSGNDENVNTEPQNVSINDIFSKDYNSREVLVFEGYVGLIPTTVSFSGGTMNVRIYERRHQDGGSYVNADLKLGTSNNNVERLPDQYQQEDLTIHTDDGKTVGVGAKVRVTATGYYSSGDYYSMDVTKIEAIDDSFDKGVFATAKELTEAMVRDTSKHLVYGYMDGVFSIPSVFYSMDGDIALNFASSNKAFEKIDLSVGEGPSTMNTLPSSYTAKDLVIRDFEGNEIKRGSKVRVYGTWERYSFVSSTGLGGQFKVEEVVQL